MWIFKLCQTIASCGNLNYIQIDQISYATIIHNQSIFLYLLHKTIDQVPIKNFINSKQAIHSLYIKKYIKKINLKNIFKNNAI